MNGFINGPGMTQDLRICMVGFGGMARSHADNLSTMDGVSLVGIADPSPAARGRAKELGYEAFEDHRTMLERLDPDAAVIASPSSTHGRAIMDCCERGIHAFSEKPLTTTLSEALQVRERVLESGITFAIGLVLRHSKTYTRAREMVGKGEIGRVTFADCSYSGRMLGRIDYVFSRELGRGLINEHTIHMIDAMEYVLGPVTEVYARTDADEEHTEYNAAITMSHEPGGFSSVIGSGMARLGTYARIIGMEGELMIEGNRTLSLIDESGQREILSGELGYREELGDFRDAIHTGRKPHTGMEEAIASALLIEAIYRSAESGRTMAPRELGRSSGSS
jgi:predicted dehydrogenase